LSDIKDANAYIDDAGAFPNDWDHHVYLLATILRRLLAKDVQSQRLIVCWRSADKTLTRQKKVKY
jgi:hypothetical protein